MSGFEWCSDNNVKHEILMRASGPVGIAALARLQNDGFKITNLGTTITTSGRPLPAGIPSININNNIGTAVPRWYHGDRGEIGLNLTREAFPRFDVHIQPNSVFVNTRIPANFMPQFSSQDNVVNNVQMNNSHIGCPCNNFAPPFPQGPCCMNNMNAHASAFEPPIYTEQYQPPPYFASQAPPVNYSPTCYACNRPYHLQEVVNTQETFTNDSEIDDEDDDDEEEEEECVTSSRLGAEGETAHGSYGSFTYGDAQGNPYAFRPFRPTVNDFPINHGHLPSPPSTNNFGRRHFYDLLTEDTGMFPEPGNNHQYRN